MRRWKRRAAAAGTATVLVLGQLIAVSPPAHADDPVTLNLLTINDFHGRIDTNTVKFAGTVEQLRAADGANGANTLLVGAGDFIGASLFASAVAKDQPTIDVMNELGLNVSAVGNHEFDQGWEDLRNRVIAGGTNATWDYLGANVYEAGTTTPALPEYHVYDVAGVRVGVIGAVTVETPTLVSPAGVATLDFGDPVDAVNRVADELTDGDPSNGEADVLVASFHEGAPDGSKTLEQNVAVGPAFAEIVNDVSPKVAAIVTGHTHQAYAYEAPWPGNAGKTRPIIQTGSYGANVGHITLSIDPTSKSVLDSTVANQPRTTDADQTLIDTYPRVKAIDKTVTAALKYAETIGNDPVGSVTTDITTATLPADTTSSVCSTTGVARDDRASESTLGNLVASALLDRLSEPEVGGAQIAVVNPGGLRADLCYAPDGVITYAEANGVLPFVNNLGTTTLTGAQVKTMLEQQWQLDANGNVPTRPYLQLGLSKNVTYTYDPKAQQNHHITSVTVDGKPLDPTADYRIGTFSFLLAGGDNFRVIAQGTNTKDSGLIDRDAWIAYLDDHQGLSPNFARHAVAVTGQPTSPVAAGSTVSFDVSKLDLTSLGSPANTSLDAVLVPASGGDPAAKAAFSVAGGAAHVDFPVPAHIAAGTWNLLLTAGPSGTKVTIPLTITATSSVTLTANPTSQVYGAANPITLTAAVTSSTGNPTGTVTFTGGTAIHGEATLTNGTATYPLPSDIPAGTYQVVAHYAGDGTAPAADSAPVTITVAKAGSVTVLAPALVLPFLGTVLIGAVGLNNGQPARGTVEIRDNGTSVGSTAVQNYGVFVFLAPRPARGQHSYTATYVPSDTANIAGSTSNPVVVRR